MEEETLRTGFDPNTRELCPDGGCIGVIGVNGRCAECGKTSSLPKSPSATSTSPKFGGALAPDGPKDTKVAPDHPREIEGDDFDPDRRELCSDGACIGVIGTDGRCAECGKASSHGGRAASRDQGKGQGQGEGQGRGMSAPLADANDADDADDTDDTDDADDADDNSEGTPHHESAETTGTDDNSETPEERQLCPDGACIGVIGSNGRCKSCGTRAE